ncbi:MAG TPA: hypothetical protein VHR45_01570 [Thermoanaerobaculia bacterium]|nr:hypothetical protein [Thermoanaerobaculia bacterium]
MKTVNLDEGKIDLEAAINLARKEPLLLVTADGQEFLLSEADDFEKEAQILRNSVSFQRFLEERSRSTGRISLDEIEAEVDRELAQAKNVE